MINVINLNKITDSLLNQTMDDIFKEFFKLEKLFDDSNTYVINWVVIRLVTIIEQFCRGIIQTQINSDDDIQLPEKFHININDLERVKNLPLSFLITSQYNFQNISTITKELKNYKINYTFDKKYKNELEKLFEIRHNIVHTISPQNYDIETGYSATENFLKSILDGSQHGLTYYETIRGFYLGTLEEYDEAMRCFIRAIDLKSNNIDAHYYIGLLYCIKKNIDDAYDRSITIINMNPESPLGYHLKGFVLAEQGKHDDAINCYDEAIKRQPDQISSHYQKCMSLFHLNRLDDALLHGNAVIELNSEYGDIVLTVTKILVILKKYNESLTLLNKKIKSHPNNADLHHAKYVVLSKLGRTAEAKQCLNEAARLDPDGEYLDVPQR